MALFLVFGSLSWLFIFFIFIIEREIFVRRRRGRIRRYSIRGQVRLILSNSLARIIPLAIFALICLLIIIAGVGRLYIGSIYSDLEGYLTSRALAQIVLGIVFGGLLAAWMFRVYRRRDEQTFSLPEKVGGLILLVVFVVGTTSITFDELIRSVSYGKDGVALQFAQASAGSAASVVETGLVPSPKSQEESDRPNVGASWGMQALSNLESFMLRDLQVMRDHPASRPLPFRSRYDDLERSITEAADDYGRGLAPIAVCLGTIISSVGDDHFLRELLRNLKVPVRELHLLAIAGEASSHPEITGIEADLLATLNELIGDLRTHTRRIQPGLSMLANSAAANGLVDERKLVCDFPQLTDIKIGPAGLEKRPYLAVLYAALLELENQELAAVEVLDDWLNANGQTVAPWYRVRILLTQYTIMESLFRREPNQPDVVIEEHLAIIEELIAAIHSIPGFAEAYRVAFADKKHQLIAAGFSGDIALDKECKFLPQEGDLSDSLRNQLSFAYVVYNAKAIFVRRAIQSSQYGGVHYAKAKEFVEDVVQANIGCLPLIVPAESVQARVRAETLVVYARYRMAQAGLRRPIGSDHQAKVAADVNMAQSALRLAKSIVAKYAEDHTQPTPVKRMSLISQRNEARRVLSTIERLMTQNQAYLDRINPS
ncbi:MAG: hypothetical protein M9939_17735 [Mesorhizobium sp.]|nr:hypothetical protein [Mesorhizobium sp.]MCO5162981.1 hypothetical protein [Mesorhizobium sp.]